MVDFAGVHLPQTCGIPSITELSGKRETTGSLNHVIPVGD